MTSPEELRDRESELLRERGMLFTPLASQLSDPDSSPPVKFGLPELDRVLGGGLRRGFHLVAGYTHSGKTQLLLRMIWENRDRPVVMFTADEDVDRVAEKMMAIATSVDLATISTYPKAKKQALLTEWFPMLAVCEEPLSGDEMLEYIDNVETYYEQDVAFVIYDYLEHFASSRGVDATSSVKAAAKKLKRLAKRSRMPWLVVHQGNRQAGDGKPFRPHMLAHGGEQEADTIIAVRRQVQMENPPAAVQQQEAHHPTIHVTVGKNKQTYQYFGLTETYDGTQWSEKMYAIDKASGLIRDFKMGEQVHLNAHAAWDNNRGAWS